MERDSVKKSVFLWVKISTHTLTWSVTSADDEEDEDFDDFNSHAHVERDIL